MYTVIIPAAGQGKRMQADKNKVLLEIDGQPIIKRTVAIFEASEQCQSIYLAAKKEEISVLKDMLSSYSKVKDIVEGGSERQHSIYNALRAIEPCEIVMVHDAARPFISHETLNELYSSAKEFGAAIAAVPAKDTVKVVKDNRVANTPDRSTLWLVQTPQAFDYKLLMEANEEAVKNGFVGTDDASLVEQYGHDVQIVESSYDNIKLTTPEDMFFAEAILKKRGL